MNQIKSIKILLSLFIIISIIQFSCKKDDNNSVSTTGTLSFHLHTYLDSTEIENYGDTLLLSNGRKIKVSTAQMYLSNIKLIKLDGSVIDGPSTIVFFKQGIEEYEIGEVLTGNYKSVRFDVGLSDSLNAVVPDNPTWPWNNLLLQPSMWFGSTAQPEGYVFVNFQGNVDDTTIIGKPNPPLNLSFNYKIGTNAHRITVTMPDQNFTVVPNQQSVRHILADYSKLFDGIQLSGFGNLSIITPADNATTLGNQVASNIAGMFRYEE